MGQISVFSPAKINLFLAVFGRMPSGFHELASLVAQVDFGDELGIQVAESNRPEVRLSCSDESLPVDGSNLAYAAAEGFLLRSGLNWRVEIDLQKRIPQGAGLGGGSGNAAAVLRGLNELAQQAGQLGISRGEGFELAAELGSDCPLFLDAEPKVMRGRGEILSPISSSARSRLLGKELLLFKPSFSIPTAWAYRRLAETADSYDQKAFAEKRLSDWEVGSDELGSILYNVFEAVVFQKYAAYGPLFKSLWERGLRPLLSGSGSACFVFLEADTDREEIEALIRSSWGERVFVERGRILV